VVGQA